MDAAIAIPVGLAVGVVLGLLGAGEAHPQTVCRDATRQP